LMFGGTWLARGIGFAAGLTLASRLVEIAQLRDHFVGLALVAVAAALSAAFYASLVRQYVGAVMPIVSSRDHPERKDT